MLFFLVRIPNYRLSIRCDVDGFSGKGYQTFVMCFAKTFNVGHPWSVGQSFEYLEKAILRINFPGQKCNFLTAAAEETLDKRLLEKAKAAAAADQEVNFAQSSLIPDQLKEEAAKVDEQQIRSRGTTKILRRLLKSKFKLL